MKRMNSGKEIDMIRVLAAGAVLFAAAGVLIPVVIVHRAEQVPVVAPLWARWTVIGCMMVAVVLAYLHYRSINKGGRENGGD